MGGRVGATRTYACGEGTGGAVSEEMDSYLLLKQETLYGSSGWDNFRQKAVSLPDALSVRAE
ncbi:MAG: hypothetical protein D6828_05755 [Nitrospirae bacterium]|nr:MAG: hypothetical protein D6828_05755 [Nitrospirota bacterium]